MRIIQLSVTVAALAACSGLNAQDTKSPQSEGIKIERSVGRSAFYRMEKNTSMAFSLKNLMNEMLPSVKLSMNILGFRKTEKLLTNITPNASVDFDCPIPAEHLRPDAYEVVIHSEVPGCKATEMRYPFHIVKRPNPERFPVLMWGGIPVQGAEKLVELGFTSVFAMNADYKYIYDNPDANSAVRDDVALAKNISKMEEAMKAGLEVSINVHTGHFCRQIPEVLRVKRDGTGYERQNACPLLPKMRQFSRRTAELVLKTYGHYPALRSALLNSEIRGGAQPCFHKEDIEAYRQATGQEIPPEVVNKWGVSYKKIKDFPESRIVPDDHPLLTYYRWFWEEGDGWVGLNNTISETLKATRKEDFLTWYDPAVRVAPVYGSGGHLDMIGHWTYTYPGPIRIGMTADELVNMARGRQKIFQMVQMIWYRSQTAPIENRRQIDRKNTADAWDDHDPDAAYITPSPAHMKEGFWAAISRPIDMIGYHGLQALLPGHPYAYVHTHPDTSETMAKVHNKVLKPFGPMLLKIDNRCADVAFLESFASQVFAQRCGFGWAGRSIGSYWLACQYAGLQSDIIFEETIVEDGLDGYKILIMADCEVLPQSVYEKVAAFQKNGGLIIADEHLVPGITPDIRVPSVGASERPNGEVYKKATLATAAGIRKALAGKYTFFAYSENPEVVLHTREDDGVQYIFAINDRKEFGDYVGPYRMVMENGLPAESIITVRRTGIKVLDLISGDRVAAESDGRTTKFQASLEPAGGKIFVITNRLPAKLTVSAPETVMRGKTACFDITVLDADRKPLPSLVPVWIDIVDPAFRPAEPSGAYAARKGKVKITFDLAENERVGSWQIIATERLTGLSETVYMRVQ